MSTFTLLFSTMYALLFVSFLLHEVEASLPEVDTHVDPREHELAPLGDPVPRKRPYNQQKEPWTVVKEKLNRLPGVCKRLRRRRITILCNVGNYCSARRQAQHGQLCRCPRGSRCSHFFLRSL